MLKKVYQPFVNQILKQFTKKLVEDPELKKTLSDMEETRKRLDKSDVDYCKKRPQSPLCKDGKRVPF